MSPRIAYWTSAFEPEMEAIAAEVATLRRRFPASVSWGLSDRRWAMFSRRRGYCVHPRLHLAFRAVTRVFEPAFELNHIFGSLGDWFYLQGARSRPTVLTVAALAEPVERRLLDRVDCFVAECRTVRDQLIRDGIDSRRVRVIFPPVDLARYAPRPRADGRFTVLFASSPDRADWLRSRGVPLILDSAALRPNMRFRLLWRPWGDSEATVRRWIAERRLTNVELAIGCVQDMVSEYNGAHAVVAPFTDPLRSKPAPNSIVDSLACGRPVVVTESVGLADVVRDEGAGIVCAESGTALSESFDRLAIEWESHSRRARRCAERRFGTEQFLAGYERLYREFIAN